MMSAPELSGYIASALVLVTFAMKDMRLLRGAAVMSNVAFIIYASINSLPPILTLHVLLLPINLCRLKEAIMSSRGAGWSSNAPQDRGIDEPEDIREASAILDYFVSVHVRPEAAD